MAGRPTKLTPALQKRIIQHIEAGNTAENACLLSGITDSTYYLWLKKGEAGESPYSDFSVAVKAARAVAEDRALQIIQSASLDSWQAAAWYLERTRSRQYGRRNIVEGGDPQHPLQMSVSITEFDDPDTGGDPGDPAAT